MLFSPSLGGAAGGAEARATCFSLLAELGGVLFRRSARSCGFVSPDGVGVVERPTSSWVFVLGLALRRGGAGSVDTIKPSSGLYRSFCSAGLDPAQGRRTGGCRSGGRPSSFRRLLPESEIRAPWPMCVQRFRSRRGTAGGSGGFLHAWRCSSLQVCWRLCSFFFASVAGDGDGFLASRWFSFLAVALVVFFRLFVSAYVLRFVLRWL